MGRKRHLGDVAAFLNYSIEKAGVHDGGSHSKVMTVALWWERQMVVNHC